MAHTSPFDPKTSEARSSWLAGLTEAMSIVTQQLNLKSEPKTITLDELLIDDDDRRRIYQADKWNKLWLTDPPPVIKMNDSVITPESDGFTIDYLGGSIAFEDNRRPKDDVTITAEVTHLVGGEGADRSTTLEGIKTQIESILADLGKKATQDEVTQQFEEVNSAIQKANQALETAKGELNTEIEKKQNQLTFDTEPNAGSTNPVESKGIKKYVDDQLTKKAEKAVHFSKEVLPEQWVEKKTTLEDDNIIANGKYVYYISLDGTNAENYESGPIWGDKITKNGTMTLHVYDDVDTSLKFHIVRFETTETGEQSEVLSTIGGGGGASGGGLTLERLSIKTQPEKLDYKVGDTFVKDGLKAEVYYTNGLHFETENVTFSPSGPLKETDTTITITYAEGKQSVSDTVAIRVTRTEIQVPVQRGTLTYNTTEQTVAWDNYDASKMDKSGSETETDAGSYEVRFTPKEAYCWPGNDTGTKTVTWAIQKAEGSIKANPSDITLNDQKLEETVTLEKTGDGEVTIQNDGEETVDAILNAVESTISIKAKADGDSYKSGSANITVTLADGKNYTGGTTKITVSAQFIPETLEDATWDQIGALSANGQLANHFQVGDTKEIELKGKLSNNLDLTNSPLRIKLFIVGFDHNHAVEANGNAHLVHWQMGKIGETLVSLCDGSYNSSVSGTGYFSMNSTNTNVNGWELCQMRTTIMQNIKNALPADLKGILKTVNKWTDNKGGGNDNSANVTETDEEICLPAEYEIYGVRTYANTAESQHQQQYSYYANNNPHVYYKHNSMSSPVYWWLRSPDYNSGGYFVAVYPNGGVHSNFAYYSFGVSPLIFT